MPKFRQAETERPETEANQVPIRSEREMEERVDEWLNSLPGELADRFYTTHQDENITAQYQALENLISARENARKEKPLIFSPEHVEITSVKPLALQRLLELIEENKHEKLGAGQAGRVIASLRHPKDVCYKVMFNQDKLPFGTNDIAVETELQQSIASLGERFGVRAPRVFSFVQTEEVKAITMERLPAVSLRDIVTGRAEVPPAFNPDTFFPSVRQYIDLLHDQDYYHRDLHDGNLMADTTTGQPYVIDFGLSGYTTNPESAYHLTKIRGGHEVEIVLQSDELGINDAEHKIRRFMQQGV